MKDIDTKTNEIFKKALVKVHDDAKKLKSDVVDLTMLSNHFIGIELCPRRSEPQSALRAEVTTIFTIEGLLHLKDAAIVGELKFVNVVVVKDSIAVEANRRDRFGNRLADDRDAMVVISG